METQYTIDEVLQCKTETHDQFRRNGPHATNANNLLDLFLSQWRTITCTVAGTCTGKYSYLKSAGGSLSTNSSRFSN